MTSSFRYRTCALDELRPGEWTWCKVEGLTQPVVACVRCGKHILIPDVSRKGRVLMKPEAEGEARCPHGCGSAGRWFLLAYKPPPS